MPVAAHTPRDIYGRVPPGGWAKRMRSHRHLKNELGPGKALSFLEPWAHFNGNRSIPRHVITTMSRHLSKKTAAAQPTAPKAPPLPWPK